MISNKIITSQPYKINAHDLTKQIFFLKKNLFVACDIQKNYNKEFSWRHEHNIFEDVKKWEQILKSNLGTSFLCLLFLKKKKKLKTQMQKQMKILLNK